MHDRGLQTLVLSLILIAVFGLVRTNWGALDKQNRYPLDLSRRTSVQEKRFWMQKTHGTLNADYDMVILGDSRAYSDFSPEAVRRQLPDWRVLNFGFSSGGLNREIFEEAETRLDSGSQFRSIVLAVTPHSLTPESRYNEAFRQERDASLDYVFLMLHGYPVARFFEPLTVTDILQMCRVGFPPSYYYREFYPDGWVASWNEPDDSTAALGSYRDQFSRMNVSEELIDDMIAQIRSWREQGIHVFAVRPSTTPRMVALEDSLSGFREDDVRRRIVEAGGVWLSPGGWYHSFDGSHLHMDSAVRFSQNVARQIGQHVDGSHIASELDSSTGASSALSSPIRD